MSELFDKLLGALSLSRLIPDKWKDPIPAEWKDPIPNEWKTPTLPDGLRLTDVLGKEYVPLPPEIQPPTFPDTPEGAFRQAQGELSRLMAEAEAEQEAHGQAGRAAVRGVPQPNLLPPALPINQGGRRTMNLIPATWRLYRPGKK